MGMQGLRKVGLKATLPRMKILEALQSSKQKHFSAEDVYKMLFERDEEIGLATIYRVLTQFESAGLVLRHNFDGSHSVFELFDESHHDHMIDIENGEVIEFYSEKIEELQKEIAAKHGYEVTDHSLVLYVKSKKNKILNLKNFKLVASFSNCRACTIATFPWSVFPNILAISFSRSATLRYSTLTVVSLSLCFLVIEK